MFRAVSFKALIVVLLGALSVSLANGQGIVTGSISGTIQDSQGAVVPQAKVTVIHSATSRQFTTTTTATGAFSFQSMPPGEYELKVEASGFRTYDSKGLVVSVGADTSLVAKMEVGVAAETVTVESSAPLIESTTQQITNTFDSKKVEDVPLGNSMDSFALFVPGVATAGDASFSNTNGAELAVNGQRARSNNYEIDGQANNDNSVGGPSIFFGNQDAISELQIVTNYSAEYGRNMGAVVNYVTKSGGNQFHGSGYEFYQGSTFDSLTNQEKNPLLGFCTPGQDPVTDNCTKPHVSGFVDNRFGGTVGGPVIKDKAWFFGSANFERQRTGGAPSDSGGQITPTPNGIQQLQAAFPGNAGVNALATIGPASVKGGNPTFFGLTPVTVTDQIDPSTGVPYDCVANPSNPGCTSIEFGQIRRFVPAPFNDYEATGKGDIQVTSKDRLTLAYLYQKQFFGGIAGNDISAGDWIDEPGLNQQVHLDWVRNFSSNFVNQFRASFSRVEFGFEGGSFPKCTRADISNCPTSVSFGDGTTLLMGRATNLPQGRIVNVIQGQDNASWQHGRHLLKIGGDWTHQLSPNVFLPLVNGSYTFPDFSSYLAGQSSFEQITAGNPHLPFVENDLAAYFQDDWRVKDNLTINAGLRWEFYQQAINLLHDRTVAQETGPNPFWDTSLPLSLTTIPHISQVLHNFSPVVGFAWTPRFIGSGDKTVIRGGFRIGYDPQFYNMFLNTATRAPVVNSATLATPLGLPASGANGPDVQAQLLPLVPVGPGINPGSRSQTLVDTNFHNPYSEQWSFGIQQSIHPRVVAEVRYVGNHTIGNFQSRNGNPALNALLGANATGTNYSGVIPVGLTPCSDSTQPGFSQGFVDCGRTRVVTRGNTAFSKYNGLQTELRIGGFHGLTSTASYTWSHSIDNASEVYSSVAGGNTLSFAQNPFDISRAEKANSGIDFPNVFGLAFIYEAPFFKHQQGFMGHLLGGWQMNTTYRFTTGQPYTTIESRFAGNTSSLCDPAGTLSTFYDACRPILSSSSAPLDSIGICDPSVSGCSLLNYVDFVNAINTPVAASAVHWIVNDGIAAAALGSPFKGVGRNTLRGQPISTVNMSMLKESKLTEKLTFQLRVTAFNLLNTQFRGVPDPLLDDVFSGTFQNTNLNPNGGGTFAGNINTDGIGLRRLEFGGKFIF